MSVPFFLFEIEGVDLVVGVLGEGVEAVFVSGGRVVHVAHQEVEAGAFLHHSELG